MLGCGKSKQFKGGKEDKRNDKDQSKTNTTVSASTSGQDNKMYAVVGRREGGGPEVLHIEHVPQPVPKANEVLAKVDYAAVNGPDITERTYGKLPHVEVYEESGTKSKYLGLECSGTIAGYGKGVSKKDQQNWKLNSKVCAIVFGGAYAQYVSVPIGHLLRFNPSKISLKEAAAIPQAACTVWSELFMTRRVEGSDVKEEEGSRLSPGQTIFIHGGCSGIGMLAIQMAKNYGATVYATAGTDEKVAKCEELKADKCINYTKQDFVEEINGDLTKGQGVDVILDCVGVEYYHKNLECLKDGGRLIQIGGCWMTEYDSYTEIQKSFKCTDVASLVYRTPKMKDAIVKEVQDNVIPSIENGCVEVFIDKVFKFNEAAQAHKLKESGNHIGKILLQPGKLP